MMSAENQQVPTIFVDNISNSATRKDISEFFAFCGKIDALKLESSETHQRAYIRFCEIAAVDTALLLNQAVIRDQPITVSKYESESESIHFDEESINEVETNESSQGGNNTENIIDQNEKPQEEKSKTKIIASLIAEGYILGSDAVDKASEFDREHGFSTRIKGAAKDFDDKFSISARANALKSSASEKANEIDQQYKIRETADLAISSISNAASAGFNKAMEYEPVGKGWAFLQTVSGFFTNIKNESNQIIEEKKMARNQPPTEIPIQQHED